YVVRVRESEPEVDVEEHVPAAEFDLRVRDAAAESLIRGQVALSGLVPSFEPEADGSERRQRTDEEGRSNGRARGGVCIPENIVVLIDPVARLGVAPRQDRHAAADMRLNGP